MADCFFRLFLPHVVHEGLAFLASHEAMPTLVAGLADEDGRPALRLGSPKDSDRSCVVQLTTAELVADLTLVVSSLAIRPERHQMKGKRIRSPVLSEKRTGLRMCQSATPWAPDTDSSRRRVRLADPTRRARA